MEQSNNDQQSTDVRSVLLNNLRQEQEQYGEGSTHWSLIQEKINQIIAENYLEYLNR